MLSALHNDFQSSWCHCQPIVFVHAYSCSPLYRTPLTRLRLASSSCCMMLSSPSTAAEKDWPISMKGGKPPVVSALIRCNVAVGASATNGASTHSPPAGPCQAQEFVTQAARRLCTAWFWLDHPSNEAYAAAESRTAAFQYFRTLRYIIRFTKNHHCQSAGRQEHCILPSPRRTYFSCEFRQYWKACRGRCSRCWRHQVIAQTVYYDPDDFAECGRRALSCIRARIASHRTELAAAAFVRELNLGQQKSAGEKAEAQNLKPKQGQQYFPARHHRHSADVKVHLRMQSAPVVLQMKHFGFIVPGGFSSSSMLSTLHLFEPVLQISTPRAEDSKKPA